MKFLALVVCTLVAVVVHGQADGRGGPRNTVQVTGMGKSELPSDTVYVTLGIQSTANTAQVAQMRTANTAKDVVNVLTGLGVGDLRTESLTLSPVYNYSDDPIRILGYDSSTTVSYQTGIDNAGETLDKAVAAGASSIDNVNIGLNEESQGRAYNTSLSSAVGDARSKASVIVQALGKCLGEPLQVTTSESSPIYYGNDYTVASRVTDMQPTPSTTIVGGTSQVSATVTVVFEHVEC